MAILDNLENQLSLFPEYQTESTSLAVKIFSDSCCNGCTCKTSKDHIKEFDLDEEI